MLLDGTFYVFLTFTSYLLFESMLGYKIIAVFDSVVRLRYV